MNFKEFLEQVDELKNNVEKQGLKPDNLNIEYFKASGENILCLVEDDDLLDYFKWR